MTKLGTLRKAAGLTQQQLADHMGVSRSTVAMWETGENAPSSKYLLELAKALSCSLDEILKPA